MGRTLVSEQSYPQDNQVNSGGNSTVCLYKAFYNHLPYYLSIGMTWDEYWNDDVCKVIYFRKMDEIKKRRKNEELWLQGVYVYHALCDVAPLLHPFNKHPKPQPYLVEPLPITKDMQEEKEKVKFNKMLNFMKSKVRNNNNVK